MRRFGPAAAFKLRGLGRLFGMGTLCGDRGGRGLAVDFMALRSWRWWSMRRIGWEGLLVEAWVGLRGRGNLLSAEGEELLAYLGP